MKGARFVYIVWKRSFGCSLAFATIDHSETPELSLETRKLRFQRKKMVSEVEVTHHETNLGCQRAVVG